MARRGATFTQERLLARGGEAPAEVLMRIRAAADHDLRFEATGRRTGVLHISGDGRSARLETTLDRKGRPGEIERIEIPGPDDRPLALGKRLEADVGRFFRGLDRAQDALVEGDLDGALHRLTGLYGEASMRLAGSGGGDRMLGGAGDDAIRAKGGDDAVLGSAGRDRIDGGEGRDALDYAPVAVRARQEGVKADLAKEIAVVLGARQSIARFEDLGGTGGRDLLRGDEGANLIAGRGGDDRLDGRGGDDLLYGGDGDDAVLGGSGDDALDGGRGDDALTGGSGEDRILGGEGDDRLTGESGDDTLDGGAGRDTLSGGSGADRVLGGEGDDLALGGSGDDAVEGGAGDDTLDGGAGFDLLTGGPGADEFRLDAAEGADTIADFAPGEDRIRAGAPFETLVVSDGAMGAEIRDAEGRLLATVLGVEAAALAEADTFL